MSAAVEGIKTRLGDRVVSDRDGRVEARCPAHDDRSPSLGLGARTNGDPGAVLYCQAGCEAGAVMSALGLPMAALFDRHWQPENSNGRREVADYDYHDGDGELLYQVVRFDPKDFRQRRPNPDGGWTWKLNGVPRVLYRLPAVRKAVAEGRRVFIVEGEKDVHALEVAGEVATCNPGGAGKWRAEYAKSLKGAEVIVVADRDEPGRKHAQAVRASLEGVAASVQVVEPAEGKDAHDHLNAGRGVDELVPVDAVEVEAEAEAQGSASGSVLRAHAFSTIRAERARWLWDGRVPLGAVTLLVGREKLGKSTLTCELAARLSRGTLDGELAGTPAATLLVSFEDSAARTVKPRLLAAGADVELVHRVVASRDGADDLLPLPADSEQLGELARTTGARLLVVDPFSASLTSDVDGHRDQHVRRALAPLSAVAERADLAVVLVAHWNKAQGGDPLSRVLGSRGLTAAVRSVLAFGLGPEVEDGSPDRVLAHAACNLAVEAASLACRIEPRTVEADEGVTLETSRLVLLGEIDTTAADLLVTRSAEERGQSDDAADCLADQLADGAWHEARAVKDAAKAAGVSDKALRTAREKLRIETDREGFASRDRGQSQWRLPLVPSPGIRAGHEREGHERETPVETGVSADSRSRSCPVSEKGTSGAKPGLNGHPGPGGESLFSDEHPMPDPAPPDPAGESLADQVIRRQRERDAREREWRDRRRRERGGAR